MKTVSSFFTAAFLLIAFGSFAQQNQFPQAQVNSVLQNAFQNRQTLSLPAAQLSSAVAAHPGALLNQLEELKKGNSFRSVPNAQLQSVDTLIVGLVPNDTVRITGSWTHTGPIWIFNDGVLIFHNANVIDTGDVYVFGTGKLLADSSDFFFPQAYFYERGLLVLQDAFASFHECSFNYSGMSHNLVVANHATLEWENVHQNDWTTCGMFGSPMLNIHGCNLSGEYILNDTCTANFVHADSVILWHQLPNTAVINYTFPNGNTVYNYAFDNTVSGVSGVNYHVTADSCNTVWWALMPVNGSDVTISNSDIRLIGAWFQHGDTASAYGIFNNSNYTNYITPLSDRNLHLINSNVMTWSMYVFDTSFVSIDSCQLGEVGTQQVSSVVSSNFILDGSGGYFWATDTSFVSAANVISYSTTRSEKNALFVLAYSWLPFAAPTSIHNSTIICVQNTLVADPVPADASVAWLAKMDGPDTASVNAVFPLTGSAWINQGPGGNPMDFGSYSLYYQLPSVSATWFPIVIDSTTEISHSTLANWNTNGLLPGTYILKQVLTDNFGDSVEGYKAIELLPNPLGLHELSSQQTVSVYPNPSSGIFSVRINSEESGTTIRVTDLQGRIVVNETKISGGHFPLDLSAQGSGIYFLEISSGMKQQFVKLVKE